MKTLESKLIPKIKLGPLEVEPEDWRTLVRSVKSFCRDFEKTVENPNIQYNIAFLIDMFFVVTRENARTHRIIMLPICYRHDMFIPDWVKGFDEIAAFGIVKIASNLTKAIEEAKKLSDMDEAKIRKAWKLAYSLEPDTEDVKLSVELDKKIGKPIYYIIMNRNFEYEIYRTPLKDLYNILRPVEDSEKEPRHQPAREPRFHCECGLAMGLEEASEHLRLHHDHKITRDYDWKPSPPPVDYNEFNDIRGDFECNCGQKFTNLGDAFKHLHYYGDPHGLIKEEVSDENQRDSR